MQTYDDQIVKEREKLKADRMKNGSLSRNYRLTVDNKALDRLNKRLGRNAVGEQQFLEKLEDIRLEPEKFWYLFDEELLHLSSKPGLEQIN